MDYFDLDSPYLNVPESVPWILSTQHFERLTSGPGWDRTKWTLVGKVLDRRKSDYWIKKWPEIQFSVRKNKFGTLEVWMRYREDYV